MTDQNNALLRDRAPEEGLPHAPMAMPEQQLEHGPLGLRLHQFLMPARLVPLRAKGWARAR